jgi:hypothetical protein
MEAVQNQIKESKLRYGLDMLKEWMSIEYQKDYWKCR